MEKSIRNKILFVAPPIVLTILTLIWLFRKDGRWYTYRDEWEFIPLLICHIIMPLFYFVSLIVVTIRQINESTRSASNIYYIVASAILWLGGGFGFLLFIIFTSGM